MKRTLIALALVLAVIPALAKPKEQTSAQENAGQPGGRFPAMYLKTHSIFTQSAIRPAWEMKPGGELIVSNGSIQFHDPNDAKTSFAFPIGEVRSLERRQGPEGFRVLRIKLQNGKHFDLVPDIFGNRAGDNGKNDIQKAMDEGVNAMEKAIRDLAAENKVALN